MCQQVIDLMEAVEVREDGMGFLSYSEIWRFCCERWMFGLHKEGFAVIGRSVIVMVGRVVKLEHKKPNKKVHHLCDTPMST